MYVIILPIQPEVLFSPFLGLSDFWFLYAKIAKINHFWCYRVLFSTKYYYKCVFIHKNVSFIQIDSLMSDLEDKVKSDTFKNRTGCNAGNTAGLGL